MRKTFPSAIGWIMIIPLVLVLSIMVLLLIFEREKWVALFILVPVALFIKHLMLTTRYTIEAGTLLIQCGFFHAESVDIASISGIKATRNPLSSPALSLDRLDIQYGKRRHVMVSPKEKAAFIAALLEINPAVRLQGIHLHT